MDSRMASAFGDGADVQRYTEELMRVADYEEAIEQAGSRYTVEQANPFLAANLPPGPIHD
jgi:hypothetical protein